MGALILALAATPSLRAENSPAPTADAVARVGPVVIREAELEAMVHAQLLHLRAEEYNIKKRALDQRLERLVLEQEAAERHLSLEELTRLEVEAKARPVMREEARAAYEQAGDRLKGTEEDKALQQITDGLMRQRRAERRAEFVAELKARRGARIFLEPARIPVDAGDNPAAGPAGAPVTLVAFSDFQCPYCKAGAATLALLRARYGDKLRVVFRDFPLPFHKDAVKAAEAAACAAEQGRFWQMHDRLFANQKSLAVADLKRYAGELGLKEDAFSQCLDSGLQAAHWQRNKEDGARYGVSGTPAFFVNGRPLSGAQPFEAFAQIVDEELERAPLRNP
jgi:protein-disulfide isomerase